MERGLMSAGGGVMMLRRSRDVIRRAPFDEGRLLALVDREGDDVLTIHQAATALGHRPSEIRSACQHGPVGVVNGRLRRRR